MIQINDKKDCCGCSACVQACPKQCISMQEDMEGFLYPLVNNELCIDCHLCEKVCPCQNKEDEERKPLKVLAAINPQEEIRMQSSSGGVFTLLAEAIIKEGGVVFGARFDEHWNVVHGYTETVDGLHDFRGSKYVQSFIGDSFKQVKTFLVEGRKVLFSGTPCQISGLILFLRKRYDNLLTVEIACHGVPSPMVWRKYLEEVKINNKIDIITAVKFRDKLYGWNGYHFSMEYIKTNGKKNTIIMPHGDNLFYRGFLNHLYIRSSCYQCPAKIYYSRADLTIADFWGVDRLEPMLDDNRGYSIICVKTEKGKKLISGWNIRYKEFGFNEVVRYNPALVESIDLDTKALTFWSSKLGVIKSVENICGDSTLVKAKKIIKNILCPKKRYL